MHISEKYIYSLSVNFCAGLLRDREWILKSLTGEILTQKKVKSLPCNHIVYIHFSGLIHL